MINGKKIIGIMGLAGSGKSTWADLMVSQDKLSCKVSLADSLKCICSEIVNEPIVKTKTYIISRHKLNQVIVDMLHMYHKPFLFGYAEVDLILEDHFQDLAFITMTGRELLQFIGTEVGRKVSEDIWLVALKDFIKKFVPAHIQTIYIDDIRFSNELRWCDRNVFIYRDIPAVNNHESEYLAIRINDSISLKYYSQIPVNYEVWMNTENFITKGHWLQR